ncbi:hypothetical protein N2152v2_000045 [Parachlorella kessleri]
MAEAEAERRQMQAEPTLCSDVSGIFRQPTEEFSVSKISGVEASVLHRTPERGENGKRLGSSSESEDPLHHDAASVESSPAVELINAGVEERLRGFLYAWGKRLVELQPKVHMSEHLTESGLFLFKCLRQLQLNACCEGSLALADLSNEVLLVHDLIACFWIAMKACSIRTQVPNRTLVSKATGAQPELLGERELAALILLDWDVNTMLRLGGFVS